MELWLNKLKEADKTCIIDKGVRKVHYKFPDGREMAEEWNTETQTIARRAWKIGKTLGAEPEWEIEIGDPSLETNDITLTSDGFGIKESTSAPIVCTRITRNNLEWRIRNLPYPINTYTITVDDKEKCIIVRTTNKKFFKKLPVPDFKRLQLSLVQENLSYEHKFNTLIISYKKPAELTLFEKLCIEEINRLPKEKIVDFQAQGDGVQCPTS